VTNRDIKIGLIRRGRLRAAWRMWRFQVALERARRKLPQAWRDLGPAEMEAKLDEITTLIKRNR
jgi:hypothetical protein